MKPFYHFLCVSTVGVTVFPKNGKILARIVFIENSENYQNRVTAKLNYEAKSKMAIL